MKYQAESGILQILQDPELAPLLKRMDEAEVRYRNAIRSDRDIVAAADNVLESMEVLVKSIGERNPLLANLMIWGICTGAFVGQVRWGIPSKVIEWVFRNQSKDKEVTV